MLIQAIENSFLLDENQKEYLIRTIDSKSEVFKHDLLNIFENEKTFMLSLLKEYKNKNVNIGIIKLELISANIRKIKSLELEDNEVYDLENELEYIL